LVPYEYDIKSALNAQIDKQVTRATLEVSDKAEDATDQENNDLSDEILAILLLLMQMRGSKIYNDGLSLALAAGLDLSSTSKFTAAISDADNTYMVDAVKSFNNDTSIGISKMIADAKTNGATNEEIRVLLASFTSAQVNRVNRFALNESWRASEMSGTNAILQLDSELNNGKQVAPFYKTWRIQATACPICIDYANVSIRINEKFFGGVDAPPVHVTCRCMLTYSIFKPDDAKAQLEMHCSGCDRFLGMTYRESPTDDLKCPISKCGTLAIPTVRAVKPAST